jgi:4'-phosphopantetheinyl transferase
MIHWLTQTHEDVWACDFLAEVELARFATLPTEKRRQDWLLGRWTAKRLLQTVIWERDEVLLPLDRITITNNPDGVPDYRAPITDHRFAISISHADGRALAVAVDESAGPIGADMERIVPRPDGFAEAYFTAVELERMADGVWRTDDAQCAIRSATIRDTWETAVWSAKEAALKALHLGLSVDTRAVSCLIAPLSQPPLVWEPFVVCVDNGRLPRQAPPLTGWWRVDGGFVLTVVGGLEG